MKEEIINGVIACRIEEILYLDKEEQEGPVYLTAKQTAKLYRYQHSGIRFLYRQFKKKNPGVIMNDASGHGKRVQVAIFLDSVKHTFKQPALVLCNESELDNWKYHCMHHGKDYKDYATDIYFDEQKPLVNKKVYVSSFGEIAACSKREWDIVVVDDSSSFKMFKALKTIKAKFKIWIVSIDLKQNLYTFSAIYDWVYPNNSFEVQKFTDNRNKSVEDIVNRAILLDNYFEELVLSRGHEDEASKKKLNLKTIVPKHIKNKDATGKKVKGTKRKIAQENKNTDPNYPGPSDINEGLLEREDNRRINDNLEEQIKRKRSKAIALIDSDSEDDDNKTDRSNNQIDKTNNTDNLEMITEIPCNNIEKQAEKNKEIINADDLSNDSIEFNLNTIPIDGVEPPNATSEVNIDKQDVDMVSLTSNASQSVLEPVKIVNADEFAMKSKLSMNDDIEMTVELEDNTKDKSSKPESTLRESNRTQNLNEEVNSSLNDTILDTKIKDLEKKTFDKYKGSFLDQLIAKNTNKTTKKTLPNVDIVEDKKVEKPTKLNSNTVPASQEVKLNHSNSPSKCIIDSQSPSKGSPQKLDDKIKELEEKTYNKFKGSLLDKLF